MATENTGKTTKAKKTSPWTGRRGGRGPRALGESIARLTRPIFGKRGFAAAEIIAEWPRIVGEDMAAVSLPERIVFPPGKRSRGTLHLRAQPGGHAIQLQHLAPQIMERINTYFGYGALESLRIVQAPLPERRDAAPPIPDAAPAEPIDDDQGTPLTRALDLLGRHVLARSRRTHDT